MIRLLLVLGIIEGLAEATSPNRESTNATAGIGANVALTSTDFCQSLCGPPHRSICGNKGSYCKPYGPPADGVGVCQGFYHLPNRSLCYFGPMTTSRECPEDRPVFCKRAAPTTPQPTITLPPTPAPAI